MDPAIRPVRCALTLIELLVVVSVATLLMALLLPALNLARESSRQTACGSNLRQFGVGMIAHVQRHGTYCSGAFDWLSDGCVTEVGWVADLVNTGTAVGKMLCPSNPRRISKTYEDLLMADTASFDGCVDRLGGPASAAPDGSPRLNPCRKIAETALAAGSEDRRLVVEKEVFEKSYNTNYTASWFLVRGGVMLDDSGNLKPIKSHCEKSLKARNCALGPLNAAYADAANVPLATIPLLGCGGSAGTVRCLPQPIGPLGTDAELARSFTDGPVKNPTMEAPAFDPGTPREGPDGWWATWNKTLQDYRGFAPVHRGACNLLFADGSVRSFTDRNSDGRLNNGFLPFGDNGFRDNQVEISSEEIYSRWSLRDR